MHLEQSVDVMRCSELTGSFVISYGKNYTKFMEFKCMTWKFQYMMTEKEREGNDAFSELMFTRVSVLYFVFVLLLFFELYFFVCAQAHKK